MIACRVLKGGFCEITQEYGNNHIGIDIVGKNYTIDTVVAHSDGIVTIIQTGGVNNQGSTGNASYGNFIKIEHNNGYQTLYAHLDTVNVKVGNRVKKGDILGIMGNTGNSYGAHLHFEVWKNNVRINPYEYLNKDLFESIETILRDENKNQLKVNVDDLRIREDASINSKILGVALLNGIYNYYETKENDGYTWYRIGDNKWLAANDDWITIYPKKEEQLEKNLEIENLKKEINTLTEENKNLKEQLENFKIFIAPKEDFYYIKLNKNQELIYKKKDSN